ncbi:PREDICTED: UPF0545 protein C22orf39 homolog isoform X2 [Thamnophis sirtalis]|uniref:Synaptic plasticity regulator PANTS n=1 Tax=Thamnophis sirtalis TaxID=35019 RepID=A0A6I9YN09_9SAUR|nr:PREDICTED: UPF0545 protein C22orf39 homolog isoform X2 [Thamnophis sirtalis]
MAFLRPPRACTDYWSEWKLCRSIRNLCHHYYTYGGMPSCAQWKKDYKNCKEWERTKSAVAKEQLCNSERERLAKKEKHAPVWKMRKSPPPDWNSPIEEENLKG